MILGAPLPATGVSAFGGPGEPSGLAFHFAGNTRVLPVGIPTSGLAKLKEEIQALELLMASPAGHA